MRFEYSLALLLSASVTLALPSHWVEPVVGQASAQVTARPRSLPEINNGRPHFRHIRRAKGHLKRATSCLASSTAEGSILPSNSAISQNSTRANNALLSATPSPTSTFLSHAANATAFISGNMSAAGLPQQTWSAPPSGQTLTTTTKGLAISYYPDWNGDIFPPEQVDYSKFDIIYFAFALPSSSFGLYFTQTDSVSLLQRLVKLGHAKGVKVVVSIGGWTGSSYFSQAVATAANRELFANNMVSMVKTYGIDGVDIDWEYPGSAGASNNYAPADTANLAIFLKLLRSKLGAKSYISMATGVQPFTGPDNQPSKSVAVHARYLDHILVMNYDVWGASANPGPNAPLSNGCGNSLQPQANAAAAIKSWTAAGMPANKILLGLPAYGYVSSSSAQKLVDRSLNPSPNQMYEINVEEGRKRRVSALIKRQKEENNMKQFIVTTVHGGTTLTYCPDGHGECVSGTASASVPTSVSQKPSKSVSTFNPNATNGAKAVVGNGDLSSFVGSQIGFNSMISKGAIKYQSSSSSFVAINGYTSAWDSCSSTPFLYNTQRNVVVTFDNPKSIALKASYAKSQKIAGFGFWDMSQDSTNYDLMRAARTAWGMS